MAAPSVRFLFAHPAHMLACGFGSGLSAFAPGTAGTLFAWASYYLIRPAFSPLVFALFLTAAFLVGIAACHRTGRDLGVADHGSIVWDEIVPFWAVLFLAPAGLLWHAAAFFVFRFFDIVKPPPANWIDARVKNGFGVMSDDAIAAAYTVAALLIAQRLIA